MGWDLRPLLAPRSIAIVGASESPDSWAPEIERSLRHMGYAGELYPINPKYDEVWGRPCLSSISELPKGVDLVVFVVPARVVVRMIDDCGARGVRGVMVVSSGFAEAGEEGRARGAVPAPGASAADRPAGHRPAPRPGLGDGQRVRDNPRREAPAASWAAARVKPPRNTERRLSRV